MSALDELVTLIDRQGYKVKVYANNHAVFGFGIYHPLDGTHTVQIGFAVFNTATESGLAEFINGSVGVRNFQVGEFNSTDTQARFAKALTQTLELK